MSLAWLFFSLLLSADSLFFFSLLVLAGRDSKEKGITKTGSIGFCWGSWVVAKMTQNRENCQAGVWAHPSVFVAKDLYEGETEQELTERVKAATLVMPSKQEPDFYRNGGESISFLSLRS